MERVSQQKCTRRTRTDDKLQWNSSGRSRSRYGKYIKKANFVISSVAIDADAFSQS